MSLSDFSFSDDLLTFAHWLAADFSNQQQAFDHPQKFAHIRVRFRPLPFDFFGAIGFYSEQVYDYDPWNPYRQAVHRLVDQPNQIYVENFALQDAFLYAGASQSLEILHTISPQALQQRCHCSMVFVRRDVNLFQGEVEPGNRCLIQRDGVTSYLHSQVQLSHNSWISLDQGRDPLSHQPLWGSTFGPLRFAKFASFAHELALPMPATPDLDHAPS